MVYRNQLRDVWCDEIYIFSTTILYTHIYIILYKMQNVSGNKTSIIKYLINCLLFNTLSILQ